ncbi:hypothetical protein OHA61_14675 [Streptomyces sp. NBC_00885]|nr:hypothetical protein OHA61_14675 [Streptomyces sp. NBC_00885]
MVDHADLDVSDDDLTRLALHGGAAEDAVRIREPGGRLTGLAGRLR